MSVTEPAAVAAHNVGVHRVLGLAEAIAEVLETEAAKTEPNRILILAMRTLAREGTALLMPLPPVVDAPDEET